MTLKLEQTEANRKQKSSTTSQTWTQLLLIGRSITFAFWPLSTQQQSMDTSHSESEWRPAAVSQTISWQMQHLQSVRSHDSS